MINATAQKSMRQAHGQFDFPPCSTNDGLSAAEGYRP